MSAFEDITLRWRDSRDGQIKDYKIPSNKVFQAIALIEEHVSLGQIGEAMSGKGTVKFTKLACAYGSILRFAGCTITDEEVYAGIFQKTNSGQSQDNVTQVLYGLLALMIPPESMRKEVTKEEVEAAKKSAPTAKGLSKARSK